MNNNAKTVICAVLRLLISQQGLRCAYWGFASRLYFLFCYINTPQSLPFHSYIHQDLHQDISVTFTHLVLKQTNKNLYSP